MTRTTEERPPWEPRSRFEIEREISELQALNKKLGKALGRAVDVLLQSGDGPEIENRKREALECLAYVRDVLNTAKAPADLDEELLVGEAELKRLRAETKEKERARREAESATAKEAAAPSPSTLSPAPSAPLPTVANINRSRQYVSVVGSTPVGGLPRPAGHTKNASAPSASQPSIQISLPPTSTPSTTVIPYSGSHGPGTSSPSLVAPWHSTPSSFDANNPTVMLRRPPAASLVDPPQATSAGGMVRRHTSNIEAEQPEETPLATYQSDPLRG